MLKDDTLRIEEPAGRLLLGGTPRRAPDFTAARQAAAPFRARRGACFETDDNDAADLLLGKNLNGGSRIHRLEQSWRWAAAAILAAGAMVYVFVAYGIPLIALWLAQHTPPAANTIVATQALQVLDRTFLSPSKLNAGDTQKAQMLFEQVAAQGKRGRSAYRPAPSGFVPAWSQRFGTARRHHRDDGPTLSHGEGGRRAGRCVAHEIAHVDRAHTLQGHIKRRSSPPRLPWRPGTSPRSAKSRLSCQAFSSRRPIRADWNASRDDAA